MPFQKGNNWGHFNRGSKGHKHSEETKKKMSIAHTGNKYAFRHGTPKCLDCGDHTKLYSAKRCRQCWKNIPKSGDNSPKWFKDRTLLKKSGDQEKDRRSSAYVTWRRLVWVRDEFLCKMKNGDCVGRIEAHHILPWAKFESLRYEVNNGITLCYFHHPRTRKAEMEMAFFLTELLINETVF